MRLVLDKLIDQLLLVSLLIGQILDGLCELIKLEADEIVQIEGEGLGTPHAISAFLLRNLLPQETLGGGFFESWRRLWGFHSRIFYFCWLSHLLVHLN